jgi:hypothetical protein
LTVEAIDVTSAGAPEAELDDELPEPEPPVPNGAPSLPVPNCAPPEPVEPEPPVGCVWEAVDAVVCQNPWSIATPTNAAAATSRIATARREKRLRGRGGRP